jgi:poly(A) polymerase
MTTSNIRLPTMPADTVLQRVAEILGRLECRPYAVGGCVRDHLLGHPSADIDIALNGNVPAIAGELAAHLGCSWFMLDEARSAARLVPSGPRPAWQIDLTLHDGDIKRDLERRDFTVNAMAVPFAAFASGDTPSLIDPSGGRVDLDEGRLRMVNSGVFKDDPLRLLRLARLATELSLDPEPQTVTAARSSASLLSGVAGERIHEELTRILNLPSAALAFRQLDTTGVLDVLFPPLLATRNIEASGAHYWDVFEHSLRTLEAFDFLAGRAPWTVCPPVINVITTWLVPLCANLETPVGGGNNHRGLTRLAAVFHDIGKPSTLTREDSGRLRFLGHAAAGAELAQPELSRLRFGNHETKYILTMVRHHLRPFQLSNNGLPTGHAVFRFFRDAGPAWREVILLALADHLATRGPRLEAVEWSERVTLATFIVTEYDRQVALRKPGRLLDGNDLKATFPDMSGPTLGRILEILEEATSIGAVRTRAEALKLASETILRDNSPNPFLPGV